MLGTMRIEAVGVGTPEWREVGGRPVFTSIVRSPLDGPLRFGPDGPDGNATAVHTEQVLAFAAEHYDHWTTRFGVARESWDWCHWGENLVVRGLDENALHVGDVLETAAGVRLEVTSPRIPCFKLAWRIGQPESVLADLTRSGWVGAYLRVLEAGMVEAGDEVRRVWTAADAITVGDLSRLITDLNAADAGRLRAVAATPALGDQARGMIRKRVAALEDGALAAVGRWSGWRPFTVERVTQEAPGVKSFRLAPADDGPIAPHRAGQFLSVQLPVGPSGETVRAWSLSDHGDPGAYRLTVRRGEGAGSGHMHEAVRAGDVVRVRPPAGRFTLDRSGFLRVALISAGVGVTPMLAMLKAHAARGDEIPPLLWLHVARSGADHILKAETQAVLDRHGFERRVFYTAPGPEDVAGRDYDHAGRPTPEGLAEILGGPYRLKPFGREIELTGRDAEYYVCGPPAFETAVRAALAAMGVPDALVRSERFGPAARTGAGAVIETAQVRFEASGGEATWSADDDLTLLDLAEAQGLSPAFSCRTGTCGTCEARLLAGAVAYDPQPLVAPAPGGVLLCCARPAAPAVVLDL